jgi:DNA polymerase III subunit epsilon
VIHKLLNLTRNLFTIDVESTGVDVQNDRIIEIGFQQFNDAGLVKEYTTRINPGIPIPPASTAVHHITDDDVKAKPTFKQLAESFARGFKDCDYAGKRVTFDLQMLTSEFARAKVSWTLGDARIVDADQLERLLVPRSLSHLYKKYTGEDMQDAHSALADVQSTTIVIEKQLQTAGAIDLPRNLDALHKLQFGNMIDLGGKFKFINGVACVAFGKWNGKPMTVVDTSYWDWLIKSEFSDEVKALASNAKLGIYP